MHHGIFPELLGFVPSGCSLKENIEGAQVFILAFPLKRRATIPVSMSKQNHITDRNFHNPDTKKTAIFTQSQSDSVSNYQASNSFCDILPVLGGNDHHDMPTSAHRYREELKARLISNLVVLNGSNGNGCWCKLVKAFSMSTSNHTCNATLSLNTYFSP